MSGPGLALGAVLCGGSSRRMGRDKALVEVGGRALAARVADALRAGGCAGVLSVGGDAAALARLGMIPAADRWPGEGPLGGLATAVLAVPSGARLVVAPCDLVDPSPGAVAALLRALDRAPGADAAVPVVAGRPEWVHAAWRVDASLRQRLAALVGDGARRLDAVAGAVSHVAVPDVGEAAVADADRPEDLPGGSGAADREGRPPPRK